MLAQDTIFSEFQLPNATTWFYFSLLLAVALFVNRGMPDHLRSLLIENLELDDNDLYTMDGPLGLSNLIEIYPLDRPELKDVPFTPRIPRVLRETSNLFSAIQRLLKGRFESLPILLMEVIGIPGTR